MADNNDYLQADIEEIGEKVDRLTDLAEENQRMIKNLYKRARFATVVMLVKWFVIIGLALGSFYFLQPFLENTMNFYESVAGKGSSSSSLLDFFKSI